MTSNVKPIPDGASVVIPMLVCRDAGTRNYYRRCIPHSDDLEYPRGFRAYPA